MADIAGFQNGTAPGKFNPSFIPVPIRPENGIKGLELLKQDKLIEVDNEVAFWFVEELEKRAGFSFCFQLDMFHKGWTALYKKEPDNNGKN
ncbi:hypothetical protein MNBD_BACTEROID01-2908 [hydrothermal vent metagenome]|uniref:Uncharacterized protein n=1 Tax=hydrothermal vent metagenome TaxID=652676 RepID=A0A3B0U705_9ZZZZ